MVDPLHHTCGCVVIGDETEIEHHVLTGHPIVPHARKRTDTEKLAIARAAIKAVLDAFTDGDIDVFHPDIVDEDKSDDRMVVTIECPEDDTCVCPGAAAINRLGHALAAIDSRGD